MFSRFQLAGINSWTQTAFLVLPQGMLDVDNFFLKVNIPPLQGKYFSGPHTRHNCQIDRHIQLNKYNLALLAFVLLILILLSQIFICGLLIFY